MMNTQNINQDSAYTLAGLITDLMQKIRNGVRTLNDFLWFLNLSQKDLAEFQGKTRELIKTLSFFNNGEDGHNGIFKLWFYGSFKSVFLSLVDKTFEKFTGKLSYEVLPESLNDFQIHKRYGDKIIKTPDQIVKEMHHIMTVDPGSEEGKLYRDGKANIWYFIHNGRLFYVRCDWGADDGGWRCPCCEADASTWGAGGRVFSSAT